MREPVLPPLPGDSLGGDRLGPYRLGASLGVGGMAVVYRAEGPNGPVAVKILHQSRITAEEVKRFRREYLTLERLKHRHVVRVYDTGEQDGYPWIAMELVDGPDLGTLIEQWQQDPPADRFERVHTIFAALCDALAHVHEQGIVHRDLKPGNVLIGSDGLPRLSDFGVVKDPGAFPTSLTLAGRLVGTVAFMAPEQITGESLDARADLYSLGALLYMMLTWRRPIVADSIAGYLARHLTETPRPPSDLEPRVPQRLERICLRLLQKDPARRYASARQVLAALGEDAPPELLPLHGREAELEVLMGRIDALLKRGIGGVLAVTGAPGSGRSRILLEAAERARAAGVSTAHAGAAETLPTLFAALPPAAKPGGSVAEALRACLGDCPWLLVIDDVDLVPHTDRTVLAELVRDVVAIEGGPLLLLASASDCSSPILTGAATGLGTEEVPITGIDRESVRTMLRDRGLHGAMGAALGRRLHDDLGGLPGPVLEQVEAMLRAGWLVRGPDGALRSTRAVEALRVEPLPLPDRVRAEEASFLRSLPDEERACLEALAVLGTPSSASLVAPMVGQIEGPASDTLAALARSGHVVATEDGLQELFAVASRRRAQVIYEDIDPGRRAAMHRAAAETLQRLHRRRLSAIAEITAHHLLHGGDPAGAYPLLILGAQRALRRGDASDAKAFGHRALDAKGAAEAHFSAGEAAKWRRQLHVVLGDAARLGGQLDAASDAYAQALSAARLEGERPAIGRVLAGVGLVALARGRPREATIALDEAVGAMEQGDPAWPEAANALALARLDAGDRAGAQRLWDASIELGAGARNLSAELGGLWGLSLLHRSEGRCAEAATLLDRAAQRGRGGTASEALLRIYQQRGELLLEEGDWSGAARLGDQVDELGDTAALPLAAALAAGLRASALCGREEPIGGQRAAREALALCRLHQARSLGLWAHPIRAMAAAGDLEDAIARLSEGGWIPEPPYDTEALRLALLGLCLAAHRPQQAREAALAALARPVKGVAGTAARIEIDAGETLARVGDVESALRAATRALLRLDDRSHRALVAAACRLTLRLGPSPQAAARLKRVSGVG